MQTNVKMPARVIRINNDTSTFTLKINKRQLTNISKKLALLILFITLGMLLMITYRSDNSMFWPLLKATGILSLIAFVAAKSNTNF